VFERSGLYGYLITIFFLKTFIVILILLELNVRRNLKWRSDLMTSFWTPVITAPIVDVGSSVSTAFQDGFQGGRGQLEQQHPYVSALVESVLDIRGSGKVLSAAVWTPDHRHGGVDAGRCYHFDVDCHFDDSADPAEACSASEPRRVSISRWHRPWQRFLLSLSFALWCRAELCYQRFWGTMCFHFLGESDPVLKREAADSFEILITASEITRRYEPEGAGTLQSL
jgi:hypothetical protein